MHREQTISEMVEEVLANQAKSLAERTGQTFDSALGVVASTEAGKQLRELANGKHRHKKAREWQARVRFKRAEEQLKHLFGSDVLPGFADERNYSWIAGYLSGLKVRKHAHRTTRFWKRSSPAYKGDRAMNRKVDW